MDVATIESSPNPDRDRQEGPPDPQRESVKDRQLVTLVMRRWKEIGDELATVRRQYWQNLAFFHGEQWVQWDARRNQLQSLAQSFNPLVTGRARLTINRIRPNTISVLSRLTHSDLKFEVPPNDSSDDLIAAARLAETILRAEHQAGDWESHRADELFATLMGGTAAIAWEWDGSGGDTIEVDGETGRVVGTGKVRLQALNVTEFGLEPGVRDYRDARYWIMGLAMTPDQVQDRYALKWVPKSDAAGAMSPMQHKLLEESGRPQGKNQCLVLCMYERPNGDQPHGRYVCIVNDTVVHQEAWPFPHDRLNVRPFRQATSSGKWVGSTYMNDAVPIQFAYNFQRSLITEHSKKVGNARLMAPFGSFAEEDFTTDPADILWYAADMSGSIPQYLRPPDLPRWMMAEADTLKAELDDVMYVHATSRGEASFDRASGQALAILAEKDDTPLGMMAREQAQGWGEIASAALEIYEAKAKERRRATIRGEMGVPTQVAWNGKDLKGQTVVHIPLEVTQPRSKAAMQAFANDMYDRKLVTDPGQYARLAGLPEDELIEVLDADVAKAYRENARMMNGMAELVDDFDDHAKHIAEHNRARKSDGYRFADAEVRSIFDDHLKMHEVQAAEEYGAQVQKAGQLPGLAQLPQAHEPAGSLVPPDFAEQQAGLVPPDPAMMQQQMAGDVMSMMPPQPGMEGEVPPEMAGLENMGSPGLEGMM